MTSRTTTLRTTARMVRTARTTGEDDDDSKDDNARTTATTARTTTMMAATTTAVAVAVARSVGRLVGWRSQWRGWWLCFLPLVAWRLHTVGIVQVHLGINLFWYKFYSACPDMPNRIYSIRIYSGFILCLFWYKSESKPFIPILVTTQCNNFLSFLFFSPAGNKLQSNIGTSLRVCREVTEKNLK
jgi:hypothetical protein